MVQAIIKDEAFLRIPSAPAAAEDLSVVQDLLDTLSANAGCCVGLAANMIGVAKRIIAVTAEGGYLVMLNPEIVKQSEPYETEEACLSLAGTRKARRCKNIRVQYQDTALQTRLQNFKGFTAQIIQHEIDHCNGILI
ncbi:formylmethionine deformylase [Syntrophobotulus glycolicus DSM 8271]|uniref:Formylmethionine deformylase n=1 Tax=Syntrophobotulus glycolicus (strain DSM 8271 / FlGlyR) TaxID=645991 RepID=F0STQ5_SYNGF|nr:peptide deformylase [Syntrophobotulus glycolicus]ADY55345.1 formylmethionine deformylase [Syntrophobotulus glycolicus DSM 8271]